jgi:oligoendopeptidase F
MLDAQRATYGDAVDPATYHRYMWLWKPHYYQYDENFYNFPYAFGHLFATGLFARFRAAPAGFPERYRELLRRTGQSDAAPLAAEFGAEITTARFWNDSLDVVESWVARFEHLVAIVGREPGSQDRRG